MATLAKKEMSQRFAGIRVKFRAGVAVSDGALIAMAFGE